MEEEIWKDVVGYEGLYEISNTGNLRSLDRLTVYPGGYTHGFKGKNIKWACNRGYHVASLNKNGSIKQVKAHRLVAMAFIPNPENKRGVNHINGIKNDNRVQNLEWCTDKENSIHAYRTGLYRPMNNWNDISEHQANKRVYQINGDGEIVASFFSAEEAFRRTGIPSSSICNCIKGRCPRAGGYKWTH